ncbi:MAG: metallophosphoesterase family protein [Aggregatilineales bacterium]
MRIGILSDIHGDYETLTTVLERLDTQHGVTQVLCAGDLIGRGPEQNRVVELIRRRGIPTVRGNHDELFQGVTDENARYLKNLPLEWCGSPGNVNIYMCHGKPGNNMWGMYRDHLSKTYLNMVLRSLDAKVLVTGHTHVPLYLRVDEGCLINPGSLYTFESQRETSHSYAILTIPEMTFDLYDAGSEHIEHLEMELER